MSGCAGIGLAGSHRTGKSTLARVIAKRSGIPFIKTTTTEVFARLGLDPAAKMDFATRLNVQRRILRVYQETWQSAHLARQPFITDRTPVDLLAYTFADIQGGTVVNDDELELYVADCFAVTNRFFKSLVLVQPGIPLIYAAGKAALNKAYIEHINTLIIGFCHHARLAVSVQVLPREMTDLETRIEAIRTISG
ncbi:MAG: ATP-binding protein [Pyrinomonadaceae bacterium MAG19_C2-C3]|nr:ATP-binding protein [Pyrinomonadaceae bacterium MAG19_C2-C3]